MENNKLLEDYRKEEWINGEWYMSPRPSPNHSKIYFELLMSIGDYLRDKKCEIFPEVDLILKDVNLYEELSEEDKPKVPDIFVVCDEKYEKVGNNIVCIPDFIVEIVSPSSIKMDYITKKEMYLNAGVKEYWIVDPIKKKIVVTYEGRELKYGFKEKVKINIFDDLEIDLSEVKLFEN